MSSVDDSLLGMLKGKNIVELIENAKAQGETLPAAGGPDKIKQRQ
jgi:ribosomal protein L12E/L44/L45/RPP1/RPP2